MKEEKRYDSYPCCSRVRNLAVGTRPIPGPQTEEVGLHRPRLGRILGTVNLHGLTLIQKVFVVVEAGKGREAVAILALTQPETGTERQLVTRPTLQGQVGDRAVDGDRELLGLGLSHLCVPLLGEELRQSLDALVERTDDSDSEGASAAVLPVASGRRVNRGVIPVSLPSSVSLMC